MEENERNGKKEKNEGKLTEWRKRERMEEKERHMEEKGKNGRMNGMEEKAVNGGKCEISLTFNFYNFK